MEENQEPQEPQEPQEEQQPQAQPQQEPKEKKEMKISLWTFYVLVASLIVLLVATASGWLLVAQQNKEIKNKLPNNSSAVVQQK